MLCARHDGAEHARQPNNFWSNSAGLAPEETPSLAQRKTCLACDASSRHPLSLSETTICDARCGVESPGTDLFGRENDDERNSEIFGDITHGWLWLLEPASQPQSPRLQRRPLPTLRPCVRCRTARSWVPFPLAKASRFSTRAISVRTRSPLVPAT